MKASYEAMIEDHTHQILAEDSSFSGGTADSSSTKVREPPPQGIGAITSGPCRRLEQQDSHEQV